MRVEHQNYQHFSHHHLLIPLKLDEGEQIHCKTCETLIFEPFHGCLQCNHYLHDHCINIPRSLEHPSHLSHPLTLIPFPTYSNGFYSCNACGSEGHSFSYSCAHCQFDLHLHCASLQTTLIVDEHPHELKLIFDLNQQTPFNDKNVVFGCDVCGVAVDKRQWVYYCAGCDFGTHLKCVKPPGLRLPVTEAAGSGSSGGAVAGQQSETPGEAANPLKEAVNEMTENQLSLMRLQIQMNRAEMISRLATWNYRP
ncbi:unnamed protein product [Ilex paraguariensis]|uniref:DC1 domain-containing protein n=1 Tax=Ilex paraguariensis TaxID=185542 RepID=A0ABC8RKS3_9AQUA